MSWTDFYKTMWGHDPDDATGEAFTELVEKAGKHYAQAVGKQGKAIIRQVVLESQKVDLPSEFYPYVFFSLMEHERSWPKMHKRTHEALRMVRDVLAYSGKTPSYKRALVTPELGVEETIGRVLTGLGQWGGSQFSGTLMDLFSKTVEKYFREVGKVKPDLDPQVWDDTLHMGIEEAAYERAHSFVGGHLLNRVLGFIL